VADRGLRLRRPTGRGPQARRGAANPALRRGRREQPWELRRAAS
jgi:hypothetical protein